MNPRADDLYEELSRVNNEMTNLQREMAKKNAALKQLDEQKNRLLGVAAHDLRNPLGVILAYSQFLETEAAAVLSAEQREFVTTIRETSEFMLRLISDLLDVSTIEAGQLNLKRHPTDFVRLIQHNIALNRVLAAKKNIAIDFDPPAALPPLNIDSNKIEQVLNNLISNAIKFSHRDTRIRVRLESTDKAVTVAVQDQGQGIPAADLSKLFQLFSRASVRSTAGEQSTGLGLAIVRKIVEGHGGRIWVESKVASGSTFSFTLPIEK
jgi:signal transduction histidine kinase